MLSSIWLQTFLWGNLCIHRGRFPGTTEDDVPHLLVKKKERKIPSLVTYLILNQRNYIFTIILIMVGEIYSLSKSSSLSKYTVVYSKVWQKLFFVENVFIGSTFPVPHLRKKETLKSSLHMKYLSRNWKHHFISS